MADSEGTKWGQIPNHSERSSVTRTKSSVTVRNNCVLHPSRSPFPVLCMQTIMCCPYLAFHMSLEQTLIFWLVNRTGFIHQKCQHFVAKLWWQDSHLLFLGFLPTSYPYIPGHLGREITPPSSPHRRESLSDVALEWWILPNPVPPVQNLLPAEAVGRHDPPWNGALWLSYSGKEGMHGHGCSSFFHSVINSPGAIPLAFQIRQTCR